MNDDRLFPAEPVTRDIARRLFNEVQNLPLICPHGHTDPAWFADNQPFSNPAELLIVPDHYILRMLVSQGLDLEELGVRTLSSDAGGAIENSASITSPMATQALDETSGRAVFRLFAEHYPLFRSTPTRLWLDHTFTTLFGLDTARVGRLDASTSDIYFDTICDCLTQPAFRPRALFERFNIEALATTEAPTDTLAHHQTIKDSGWDGNVITTYRPDSVTDPDFEGFHEHIQTLGHITGEDTGSWHGYLAAHRARRAYFATMGATATDHGHPTAATADLGVAEAERLFTRICTGNSTGAERELFRAQMLVEMAAMSCDDGLVMQIHPGSWRNHHQRMFQRFGRNMGFDIPTRTEYVSALQPLLQRFGMHRTLSIILFTLDETTYSRELAPLAGVYPVLKLGPPWWFFDSADGMLRFREQVTETAGYYNTAGFNDDTRAFPSIPARHDVARRVDCSFLARQVAEHKLDEDEAMDVAVELAYKLAKRAYRL